MPRSRSTLVWSRLVPLALLPGCLVAFNDYPLGERGSAGAASVGSGAGGTPSSSTAGSGGGVDVDVAVPPPPANSSGNAGALGGSSATAGSGVGGSSPSGGGAEETSGGSGEQPSVGGAAPDVDPYLLDDFEDGDERIFEQQGRRGAWFVKNDGSGKQAPAPGDKALPSEFMLVRNGSTRGMHTSGGPFETGGATLGTTLAATDSGTTPYDLSVYRGLKLWVRSNAMSPAAAREVRLNLVTPATSPGGGCTVCGDHWGFVIPLTSKWVQVDVAFADVRQQGSGRPRLTTADLTSVTSLELQFPAKVSFDFWIDDIELY